MTAFVVRTIKKGATVLRPLKLLFMGDSITEGQYVDASLRWTSILQQRDVASAAGTAEFINRGVSGQTTRQGLERFPNDVQSESAPIVMIQFGMNDCNCWESDRGLPRVSEAAFVANLVEMADRCRSFETQRVILATNPRSLRRQVLPSGEVYEEANARYSQLIRDAAATAGVVLCDVRAEFEQINDIELAKLLLPSPDLLHLSPLGHAYYASICAPVIDTAIMELRLAEVAT